MSWSPHRVSKHQREVRRDARAKAKLDRRQGRAQEGDIDYSDPPKVETQFPSAYPDAPPEHAGIARTLSRGR
jgi:hypothetical protein